MKKNIILYSVLAGAIVLPNQCVSTESIKGEDLKKEEKILTTLPPQSHLALQKAIKEENYEGCRKILKELHPNLLSTVMSLQDKDGNTLLAYIGKNLGDFKKPLQIVKNLFESIPQEMWFPLLNEWFQVMNEKDKYGRSALHQYQHRHSRAYKEVHHYMRECLEQIPKGKSYLALQKAIKEEDDTRCRSILKELSLDLDQFYNVMILQNEEGQTLFMEVLYAFIEEMDFQGELRYKQRKKERELRVAEHLY